MSFEIAKKFIDMLLTNDESTRYYVDTTKKTAAILDFIGGEPLLEVELIDKIVDYFQEAAIRENHPWQYNFRVSISSNGTLYFKPEVQKFIKNYMMLVECFPTEVVVMIWLLRQYTILETCIMVIWVQK